MLNQVRGTHDLWGDSADLHTTILEQAQIYLSGFGYKEIITPILEWEDLFERTLGNTADIIRKELFRLVSRGDKDKEVVLRPEGTAPVMRAYLSHFMPPQHEKFMYRGPMFRYDRPQKGRQRQFYHVGVESIGSDHPWTEIETIAMALGFLNHLGIHDFQLELNTLGDEESRHAYTNVLVSYFSGCQSGLSAESKHRLLHNPLRILDSKAPEDQPLIQQAPLLQDSLTDVARDHFHTITSTLSELGIPYVHNHKLVRGLDYYSHTIFEITTDKLGAQGTLLAGGRYDKLAMLLGAKKPIPAIGWAMGVERVRLLMESSWKNNASTPAYALIPLDDSCIKASFDLAQTLRKEGFSITMLLEGKVNQKFKRAVSLGSPIALIIGPDEAASQTVSVKDLSSGEQKTMSPQDVIEHLQTQA